LSWAAFAGEIGPFEALPIVSISEK
jgi:hypothetical protein